MQKKLRCFIRRCIGFRKKDLESKGAFQEAIESFGISEDEYLFYTSHSADEIEKKLRSKQLSKVSGEEREKLLRYYERFDKARNNEGQGLHTKNQ